MRGAQRRRGLTGARHVPIIKSFPDAASGEERSMTSGATFRTRLASSDERQLHARGAAADELRRGLLVGSRLAVVDPGYASKRFLYERAAALGVELVLVGDPRSWARTLVSEHVAAGFVEADASGGADAAAASVLAGLAAAGERLDGVVTFWEDAVAVAARVAAALGLPGPPPAAADGARSKQRTLEASSAAGLPTPRFFHLDGAASLAEAAATVGFPAVIKPVYGAEALGCLRVDDRASLEAGYARVAALISPDLNAIFQQGCDLLLEEYLDGVEFDVDFVLSGGELVFSALSENWPTDEPYFVETGLHSPSTRAGERVETIVELCVATARALGFRDGVFHAEAKDTSRGARLLELNARLGGGPIADLHRLVTGVDLVEQQLLVAVGLPPAPTPFPQPACGAAHVVLQAARSGRIANGRFLDHLAADEAVFQHTVTVDAGEQVTAAADGFPTTIAELAVSAPDADAARARARAIVAALRVPYLD